VSETTRRQFLAGAAGALAAAVLPRGILSGAPNSPATWTSAMLGGSPVNPYDMLVVGGRVIDPASGIAARRDIGIIGGRIARVAESIPVEQGRNLLEARGMIVTPGLIDAHVHVYDGVSSVSIEPDVIGIARGVTAVIDAGSAGATTFPGFRTYVVGPARTRVYALLNISQPGMTISNELASLGYLNVDAAVAAIDANRDVILGIKVRMIAGIPGNDDQEVMRRTREAADRAGVPVMVHIGGQSSPLPRILDFLRPGDVVTHAMRRDGSILDANGRVYAEVREAVRNGIYLDIGHGRGNLDFDAAERILQQGVLPDIISSDVHRGNAAGPVFDLPTTLAKFMQMGMTLEQVIERATINPAKAFRLTELGTLREGALADLAVFEVTSGDYDFIDSGGKRRRGTQRLAPYTTLRGGRAYGSITAE